MSEHEEQVKVIQWKNMLQNRYPALGMLFAVPNGGERNKLVATKLKAEGVQPGVLDLIFPVPRKGFTGLVIEMKYGKNKLTPEQRWWMESFKSEGWLTHVCYSGDSAIEVLCKYLDIEDPYG